MLAEDEADRVARLCRLRLSADERRRFTAQLNEILGYVEKLKELDVSGIEPTLHVVPLQNVFRPDETRPSFDRGEIMANAPDPRDGFFRVPKILED